MDDVAVALSSATGLPGLVVKTFRDECSGKLRVATVYRTHEAACAKRVAELVAASKPWARLNIAGYVGHVIGKGGRIVTELNAEFCVDIQIEADIAYVLRSLSAAQGAPNEAGACAAISRIVAVCKAHEIK